MANIPIRDIALTGVPTASSKIVFDDGQMKAGLVSDLADGVRPVASQGEAEAGTDNAKTMTALRVKQQVTARIGVDIASQSALATKADVSSLSPVATSGDYNDLSNKPTLGTAAFLNVGSTSGTVAAGDDIRFAGVTAIADQATAEAGVSNTTLMSPLRTTQHLEARIGTTANKIVALDGGSKIPTGLVVDNSVATPAAPADGIDSDKLKFSQAGASAVAQQVQAFLRLANGAFVSGYTGADASGVAASDAAISSAVSASDYVVFPAGLWRIGANLTLPAGKVYRFMPGAQITVDAGVTLTIRGVVEYDGFARIFTGAGSVIGVRSVRPEWFGAVGDGVTNDAPAINRAAACVEGSAASDGGKFEIWFGRKTYAIGSFVGFSPSSSINWHIRGCGSSAGGTVILAKASMTDAQAFWIRGQTLAGNSNASWSMSGFLIVNQTAGSGATVGFQIGEAAKYLNGLRANSVSDVVVQGFQKNRLITGKLTRLIDFTAVSDWPHDSAGVETTGAIGLAIEAVSADDFVGDLNFNGGQTVGTLAGGSPTTGTTSGTGVSLVSGAADATISGVRFNGFIWYYGLTALSLFVDSGGDIRDIWVNSGCQFEGAPKSGAAPTSAIVMNATGAGSLISAVFIDKPYMSGLGWWYHVKGLSSSSGSVENVIIDGGYLRNAGFSGINFDGSAFSNITVKDVQFPAAESGVTFLCYFKNVRGLTMTGNEMGIAAATINSFIFLDTGCNWIVAQGNNSNGQATTPVNNASGGANVTIGNNI